MKTIPHLQSAPAKTDIFERFFMTIRMNPVREYSLVRLAKLTRSRQNSATVDVRRKIKCCHVFQDQNLRGQLGCAVKRQRRLGRKFLGYAVFRQTRLPYFVKLRRESA